MTNNIEFPAYIVVNRGIQITLRPLLRQPYADCVLEAGFVEGHPVDTMYLALEREAGPDQEPEVTTILLRPDEMAAIAWLATGVLWSHEIGSVPIKGE